jgi:hypothetical protein
VVIAWFGEPWGTTAIAEPGRPPLIQAYAAVGGIRRLSVRAWLPVNLDRPVGRQLDDKRTAA